MKTVKRKDEVRRVSDDKAAELVAKDGYRYCPKQEYKKMKQNRS